MGTTQPIRNQEQLLRFKNYYKNEKKNKRNELLIVLALNSALRISDILSLKCKDVYDYQKKELKHHLTIIEKKTGKRNTIYMNKEIQKVMLKYVLFEGRGEEWLFGSQIQSKNPLSRQQAYRIIREAAEKCGLSGNVSCHSLRKTFGYHAWKQGVPPAMLMNIFNHSSYAITRRYLGIEQDDKDEVYQKIQI